MADAKKKATWQVEGCVLTVSMPSGITKSFDLSILFPLYAGMDEAQKYVVRYGVSQCLSDKTARNSDETLTDAERIDVFTKNWDSLLTGEAPKRQAVGEKISVNSLKAYLKESGMSEDQIAVMIGKLKK